MKSDKDKRPYKNQKKVIITEGEDDANFIFKLLKKLKINTDLIWMHSVGGSYEHLSSGSNNSLKWLLSKDAPFKRSVKDIAIIHDLDQRSQCDAHKKLSEVVNDINEIETSFIFSNKPNEVDRSTVLPNIKVYEKRIFTFFFEKNLEDVYLKTLCTEDKNIIDNCATQFFSCADIAANHKQLVQAFLATKSEIRDIGSAARKNVVDFEHNSLDSLKKFLTDFFNINL